MLADEESKRRAILQAQLLPPGTPLSDVPPDHKGLSLRQWRDLNWLEMRAAIPDASAPVSQDRIITPRDNYGWRSIPRGTRFIGEMK